MAESEVEICNAALSRIGQTDQLAEDLAPSLDALAEQLKTPAAQQCALWYPKLRDELLRWRAFSWPFATRRTVLAVVAGEDRSDWQYVYAYPSDALAVRHVTPPGLRNPRPDEIPPTKIEARRAPEAEGGGIIGKLILCDQKEAEISYTVRVENVAAFPVDFERALIARLAAALAFAIVKGAEGSRLGKECLAEYEVAIREAAAAALNEQKDDPEPDGQFLASRR